jgi:hypothetical protein
MKNKVDKRLQEALDKAITKKASKDRKLRDANQAARDEHQKYIKKWLPKARAWIDEKLFTQIAEAESEGRHYILLGRYELGIPSEAIYEAAKKIKGIRSIMKTFPIYENAEYQCESEPSYSIEWDSTDPNDHRNDR